MAQSALWYHGAVGTWQGWREDGPTRCEHWNCYLGIHFASKRITAERFASEAAMMSHDYFQYVDSWRPSAGEVVTARLDIQNPLVLDQEKQLDALALAVALNTRLIDLEWVGEWADRHHLAFDWPLASLPSMLALLAAQCRDGGLVLPTDLPAKLLKELSSSVPSRQEMAQSLLDSLRARGHDGIIYGNVLEGSSSISPYEPTATCFSHDQMEVLLVEPHSVQPILA
jgi:hypothetical protein